ncbi:Por secretion system C-terminal sorting domain-containing protein [Hymenobacter psychrophilus]|uniref:Por secretion system C-terminal sorting domain-containing protein n=2 Tax=Hymenobacter psychrophilus TaxID=651662 RepID=A0A1H3M757_9BACT|nr:Por secretion system C-terminal sorting domain-containing protein [Hymenobacter psychrophilus]
MPTAPLYRAGRFLLFALLSAPFTGRLWAQAPARPAPPATRLAPNLRQAGPSPSLLRVSVTDEAAFRQWLGNTRPDAVTEAEPRQPGLLRVRGLDAAALTECPLVKFVQAADRRARPERELGGLDFGVNKITTVHARYPTLTGQGLTVSVKESPLDIADLDFKGRLLEPDPLASLLNSHSTIMATIIAGGGNTSPDGRGVAWRARIAQSSYDNLLPDDGALLAARGVSVQNHSYGVDVENFYGLEARAYDQQARQYPTLLHVFSSGNSGQLPAPAGPYAGLDSLANLTGEFKNAKNSFSVGVTDAFGLVNPRSSRGPAVDGRVKPELVAYGAGGSSDAAALVSGISLLVQQAHQQRRGTLPTAALVRAALLNSADDVGRPQVDFVAGYGQADALGAVQTVLDNRFVEGTATTGQERVFPVTVPAGVHRLKITLTWTDPEAAAGTAAALVNDLDLTLRRTTTNQQWLPWTLSAYPHRDSLRLPARRRPNHRDNAEQITVDVPAAGTYELRVRGFAVPQGPQAFSVAYEFETGLSWVAPTKARGLDAASASQLLRWQWAGPATSARLEYKPVGQPAWTVLSASVNLADKLFRWTTPDAIRPGQLRLVAGATTALSDTFFVARPLALNVAYSCPEEALLTWRPVPGATQYQVYALGATHLEPLHRLTDTTLLLTTAEIKARYFAVAPVLSGRVGPRGATEDVLQEDHGCYVRSFTPRLLVTDSVRFDLTLGSLYRLQAVALERRQPDGSFLEILSLNPVPGLALQLADPTAPAGYSQYRARLMLSSGAAVFSQPERVFRVSEAPAVLVYPVPLVAGEPLRIVLPPNEAADVRLFDLTGRLLRAEVAEIGVIKRIATNTLRPGTYLLRIRLHSGPEITRRFTVL